MRVVRVLSVVALLVGLVQGCVDLTRPQPMVTVDAPVDLRSDRPPSDVKPPDVMPDTPMDPIDGGDGDGGNDGEPAEAMPDLPMEAPPLETGRPCASGAQCASGICAQGVCCGSDCSQICHACNLPGMEGVCQVVAAGEDPRDSCTRELPSSCGQDGTCDGAGSCRRYPKGAECQAGRCLNGIEYAASTCDGAGVCASTSSKACTSGICAGDSCGSPCSVANPCQPGFYCDAGRCALTKPIGSICTVAGQCSSGFCVDGYCCTSGCAETCFACNVATKIGTCTAVPTGQDPRNQCVAQAATTCGRAGGCNGTGGCRLHPVGTTCGPTSCAASVETLAPSCDGIGSCRPSAGTRACDPYSCGDSACATSCATADACAPAYSCVTNACVRSPGLVLFWRFEDTGNTVLDSSGNNLNGTLEGSNGVASADVRVPPLVVYPNAHSRNFSQSYRHAMRLAGFPAALRFTNNFTIAMWYRATQVDTNNGTEIGSELVSGADAYTLRLRPNNTVEFSKNPGPSQCRGTAPNHINGLWHHIAATSSSVNGVRLYYDGALVCSSNNTADVSYTDSGSDFWVGRHGDGQTQWDFSGSMDEIRLYNRVLTPQEITSMAQGHNN